MLRFFVMTIPLLAIGGTFAIAIVSGEPPNEAAAVVTSKTGINGNNKDWSRKHNNVNHVSSSAMEEALRLHPPTATSVEGGDTESSEWWLKHEVLLRLAWKEWDERQIQSIAIVTETKDEQGLAQPQRLLPSLDVAIMVDPNLRSVMDRTRISPTLGNEASVRRAWDEVLALPEEKETAKSTSSNYFESSKTTTSEVDRTFHHRVYQHKEFLTNEGVMRLRSHLDALSDSGIPKRRPNAMNRNGLLLDPSVPGGVSGDPELQNFVETLANNYLRPLGRSLFPEFAGDPRDDSKHYAFTIKYGAEFENDSCNTIAANSIPPNTNTTATTDWDLKEHSDASVYTFNINLNLPGEDYSGSSLYFVAHEEAHSQSKNTTTSISKTKNLREIHFEPGTALIHRGMTKHGAKSLECGKRNNLVIWLHGIYGYVRTAPYEEGERLSVKERWSTSSTELEKESEKVVDSTTFYDEKTHADASEL
jgi:hypothetical protein